MFNIGFSELILILLVAFFIVGPKDLPKVARALGKGVRQIKRMYRDFMSETGLNEVEEEFRKTSREVRDTLHEADPRQDLKDAAQEVKKAVKDAEQETRQTVSDIKKDMEE